MRIREWYERFFFFFSVFHLYLLYFIESEGYILFYSQSQSLYTGLHILGVGRLDISGKKTFPTCQCYPWVNQSITILFPCYFCIFDAILIIIISTSEYNQCKCQDENTKFGHTVKMVASSRIMITFHAPSSCFPQTKKRKLNNHNFGQNLTSPSGKLGRQMTPFFCFPC